MPVTRKADLMYFIEDVSSSVESFAKSLVSCEMVHDKCEVLLCGTYNARVIEKIT